VVSATGKKFDAKEELDTEKMRDEPVSRLSLSSFLMSWRVYARTWLEPVMHRALGTSSY
jgi:hypothetical protein